MNFVETSAPSVFFSLFDKLDTNPLVQSHLDRSPPCNAPSHLGIRFCCTSVLVCMDYITVFHVLWGFAFVQYLLVYMYNEVYLYKITINRVLQTFDPELYIVAPAMCEQNTYTFLFVNTCILYLIYFSMSEDICNKLIQSPDNCSHTCCLGGLLLFKCPIKHKDWVLPFDKVFPSYSGCANQTTRPTEGACA